MAFIIVDTDILIDAANGEANATQWLLQNSGQSMLAVSAVTQMELLIGCRNKAELRDLRSFLRAFHIFKITATASDRAVLLLEQYRLSHGLAIADALIAATALESGEPFMTKNQRDFRFIPSLNLLPYP